MVVASLIVALAALLVGVVTQGCASGWIPLNHVAGFRIPSVMASPTTWRAGHRAAAAAVWAGAVVAAVLALAPLLTGAPEDTASALVIAACAVLLAGVAVGGLLAHRAAVAVPDPYPASD
jgi:hypothetical protein